MYSILPGVISAGSFIEGHTQLNLSKHVLAASVEITSDMKDLDVTHQQKHWHNS